jgi:hypothetical protein
MQVMEMIEPIQAHYFSRTNPEQCCMPECTVMSEYICPVLQCRCVFCDHHSDQDCSVCKTKLDGNWNIIRR